MSPILGRKTEELREMIQLVTLERIFDFFKFKMGVAEKPQT